MAATELCKPLTHVINTSIESCEFANRWKISTIIPLLKSNESSRMDPASYRLVALLPSISKLVERSVQTQLQSHLENKGLLNNNAHAYRTGHSTSSALLQLSERLYTATDKNMISQLLAVDMSSAYDCVSHPLLLRKLQKYGCSQESLKWFNSYLSFRSQTTKIGRHNSDIIASPRGVLQVSILGPLMFLVFTNKVTEAIKDENCINEVHENNERLFGNNCDQCGQVVLYADDLTYHIANKHRVQNQLRINLNMSRLEAFLTDNELAVNAGKTALKECMLKQKKARMHGDPPHLVVRSRTGELKVIKDTKYFRVLGATIQQNLGWSDHLEKGDKASFPRIRRQLGAMKIMANQLPRGSKKLLMEGFLISKFQYLITLWGSGVSNRQAAQRILSKMARWVTGCGRNTRINSLMEQVGWKSIQEMETAQCLSQMWRIVHSGKPVRLREKIVIEEDLHLTTRATRLQFTETSFLVRTVKLWNTLNADIREAETPTRFKRMVNSWIAERRNAEPD